MDESHLTTLLAVFDERELTDDLFIGDLDPTRDDLVPIIAAHHAGHSAEARRVFAEHFRKRERPVWLYDARGGAVDDVKHMYDFRDDNHCPEHEVVKDVMNNRFVVKSQNVVVDMGPSMEDVTQRPLWSHGGACCMYNRHYSVRALCSYYARTRDRKYADKAIQFVSAWLDQRPFVVMPHIGPQSYHITSQPDQEALSLTVQMVHWIDLLYSGIAHVIPDELLCRVIRRMWFTMLQYRRFDADTYAPGNHHLGERGEAPIIYGTMFPEFVSFHSFLRTGPAVVKRHLDASIGPDGGPIEHSVTYGGGSLHQYGRAVYYGEMNGLDVLDPDDRRRAERLYLFNVHSLGPDGQAVPFGDGGGRARAGGLLAPALVAGLGEAKAVCEALESCPPFDPPLDRAMYDEIESQTPPLTAVYDSAGFLFARDGWHTQAMCLAMAVPDPEVYLHGHQDPLSVLAYVRGRLFLGHPAFEFYSGMTREDLSRIERGRFYNMTTQNCLLVHSHPVKPDEAFVGWFGHPAPRCVVEEQRSTDDAFYVRAYHDGYEFVRHTRQAVLVHGKGILLEDSLTPVEGKVDTQLRPYPRDTRRVFHTQRWHLDFGVSAEKVDEASVLLEKCGEHVLLAWLPDQICTVDIRPLWEVPMPPQRAGEPPALVVDMLFGPSIEASVPMSVTPVPDDESGDRLLGPVRRQLVQWREDYCTPCEAGGGTR